ncbi:MAG: hypothetical protein NW215_08465 [Hyphomicrobiales bacterium]|nr:hypothetical protein [Hyphomicrobiales bacterium]
MRALGCLCVALIFSAQSAVAFQGDVTGDYLCEGRNASGGVYRGAVTIVRKGDVYLVDWRIGERDTYKGIGVLTGDVLSVSYYGGITGVVAYAVGDNGVLEGKWAVLEGDGRVFQETLRRR